MRTLIHVVKSSLFPNADPDFATWAEPPPEIITVQSLLHVSLHVASLFADFQQCPVGNQWADRYFRNRGGGVPPPTKVGTESGNWMNSRSDTLTLSLSVILRLVFLLLDSTLSRYL